MSSLCVAGNDCQKRWKSIRDHYKKQKREEKGSTGSAAKKKRASYWDRLRFLDGAEEERDSFSNVPPETFRSEPKISEIAVKQQTRL